jgi:hypothetical protein
MNTAYGIGAALLVLAIVIGLAGAAARAENDDELGVWFLAAAAVLTVGAAVFAGVGLNIQYYA